MTGRFELPRAEPNGLAVHHLNLSVTSSDDFHQRPTYDNREQG
eukprot:gene499-178_t